MLGILYNSLAAEGTVRPFTREDHREKESNLPRNGKHAPRRSQTQNEYYLPSPPPIYTLYTITPSPLAADDDTKQLQSKPSSAEQEKQVAERPRPAPRRPALGPPRRSYSVTDHEPIPHHHRPSSRLQLMDLPSELHYAIFDFLDPIDSTCFGLCNRTLYSIHRRLNGTVPLSARRKGPNELEWAWHLAGNIVRMNPSNLVAGNDGQAVVKGEDIAEKENKALSSMRVRGQAYCRKCGVTRCQLHKHIQQWMGDEFEYCSVKKKFGPVAPEGAKPYCFMRKPGDETRCGRHFVRRNKVVLQ